MCEIPPIDIKFEVSEKDMELMKEEIKKFFKCDVNAY